MHVLPYTPSIPSRHPDRPACAPRAAFTLVELLVALVIMLILVSLSLGGMAAARSRARFERTRATIRKLHEIVIPHYEGYLRRRLPLPSDLALVGPKPPKTREQRRREKINLARLKSIRTLMVYEMPDSWGDVAITTGTVGTLPSGGVIPPYAWTGAARGYASARGLATPQFADSECLYQFVAFGVNEPGALGTFRSDEIADTDGDGAPEFIDAWGTPIGFVRWPAGAHLLTPPSPVQPADGTTHHDPFDPNRLDNGPGYALMPLIFSAGPDKVDNVRVTPESGWTLAVNGWTLSADDMFDDRGLRSLTLSTGTPAVYAIDGFSGVPLLGGPRDPSVITTDNITNHDLTRK